MLSYYFYDLVMGVTAEFPLETLPLVGCQDDKCPFTEQSSTDTACMPTGENNSKDESKVECDPTSTTCFVSNDTVVRVEYKTTPLPDEIESRLMGIRDFLAKPQLYTTVSWTTSQAFNTDILGPTSLLSLFNNVIPWADKVRGFNLIRGDFIIRLVLNANPFQSGLLLARFLPNAEDRVAAGDGSYLPMHNANLVTKIQQPHVEVNCRDAVAILRIPYIAPTSYIDVQNEGIDWGHFYITVLSPLATGSSGELNVNISMYCYLENVELAAPCVPQSDKRSRRMSGRAYRAEEQYMDDKPISSGLAIVASAADTLGRIPVLAPVTEAVSWASRVVGSLVSSFGWSKPQSETPVQPIAKQVFRYGATSDGIDLAYPLALIQDNRVRVTTQSSITDEDEMSFDFLKRIPHLHTGKGIQWTTSNATGTNLLTIYVSPLNFLVNGTTSGTGHTVTWVTGAPWVLLGNQFSMWRGSVDFLFKFVKTQYHTGTIQVTWTPATNPVNIPTTSTSLLSYRDIIDIRHDSEVYFRMPYYIFQDYLSTVQGSLQNYQSGVLTVDVVNELRCPETASPTIEFLVYAMAGEDFEYQCPSQGITFGAPFSPQACDEVIIMSGIGETVKPTASVSMSQYCVGEHFTSLKQILNRFSQTYFYEGIISGSSGSVVSVWPWYAGVLYSDPVTRAILAPNAGGDAFSWICPWYAFFRGGVRIALNQSATIASSVTDMSITCDVPSISNAVFGTNSHSIGTHSVASWNNASFFGSGTQFCGVTETEYNDGSAYANVPYYCKTPFSMMMPQTTLNASYNELSQPLTRVVFYNQAGALIDYSCYRSFRDDFQLSYFIGTVPYFKSTT